MLPDEFAQPASPASVPQAAPEPPTLYQGPEECVQGKKLSQAEIDLGADPPTAQVSRAEISRQKLLGKPPPHVPGYEDLHLLGAGTYGEVWYAREEGTGIQVAIKLFVRGTGQQWQLLQEEMKRLAELDGVHGIVHLKGVFPHASPPYYVMAYAEQGSLAERLKKQGPLPLAEALAVFRQAAEALAYVHAKAIRHCDLKPGNVLLDARGRPLIADFGQAYLGSGDADTPGDSCYLGTFFYMAPEQADLGRQLPDTRWDVYGLGALFYTLLTGCPPRHNEGLCKQLEEPADMAERLRRYRAGLQQAPRPRAHRDVRGMDRPLAEILDRCLELDAARRLRDANAVLAELNRRDRRRRQRPLLLFGLLAPVLLLAFMAYAGYRGGELAVDRSQQELEAQFLESDRVSARLVANVVQEELQHRTGLLRAYGVSADYPQAKRLYEAVRAGRRADLDALLLDLLRTAKKSDVTFSQALVADTRGRILAIARNDGKKIFRDEPPPGYDHYSWRDWFSGGGDRPYEPGKHYPPIAALHVSDPYVSAPDGLLSLSLSLPLRDPAAGAAGPVAGVLEVGIRFEEIQHWLLDVKMADCFPVLLDRRRYCVLHHDPRIKPAPGRPPPTFDFSQVEKALRDGKPGRSGTLRHYRDPVNGRTYLAGYAPMRDDQLGWVALVQHDREAALRPTVALRAELGQIGWILSAGAALLTATLWGWLFWMLRRTEEVTDGRTAGARA